MIDIKTQCQRLLGEAGILTAPSEAASSDQAIAFEGATVLGFIVTYSDTARLLQHWQADARILVSHHAFALRRAQAKAWNTYTVFLASAPPSYADRITLSAIEEDLVGTRKIAQAGIDDAEELRTALLPLLPLQHAPRLEAVDMKAEIMLRTTELPPRAVEAFLSTIPESAVMQMLEELE